MIVAYKNLLTNERSPFDASLRDKAASLEDDAYSRAMLCCVVNTLSPQKTTNTIAKAIQPDSVRFSVITTPAN